jgi:hypothetical protein
LAAWCLCQLYSFHHGLADIKPNCTLNQA